MDRVLNGDNPEDFTWRKPQKNMWHNEGIYMPSVEKKGVGDLIIACDTSASNWSARKIILAEVNRISEDIKPNSITIIQCDTIVKDVKRYDWRDTEHAEFDDHSQAYLPHMDKENGTLISLNIEAVK